ncbi:prolyl oligopeptidase family serine peptidase [Dysgonomonas hofstadii]
MNLRILFIFFFLISYSAIFSQKEQRLNQIYTMAPVKVQNPVMMDSVNMKGKKFTEDDLLKMSLTIPEQTAFVRPLKSDTAGYFYPTKPETGTEFQLFSFYVYSDRYAKGNIKVTSPNMLEIYVDGKLSASKTTKEDLLRSEKSVTAAFGPSYPAGTRIVIKLLTTSEEKSTALKITVENEKKDDRTIFTTENTSKRFITFPDTFLGKRITGTSISPNGGYILISYRNMVKEKAVSTTELYEVKTGKQVLINSGNTRHQLAWMPVSEKLYYTEITDNGTNLITIDPATLEETVLAKNIPNQYIRFSPDERTLYYSKTEKADESKSDLKLWKSAMDRQPQPSGFNNRSYIYKYDIHTGLSQQLTYGSLSTRLNDISPDSKQLLFSMSEENPTERPFYKSSMFRLDLATMQIDTLWVNDGFTGSATFSPDGKKILIQGSAEAFGGIGQNIDPGQIANSYNKLAFIMDLDTKKVDPFTKDFDPSINSCFWNKKDNLIYLVSTDMDYVNIYKYNPSNRTFSKLPLNEDVIQAFSAADNGEIAVYYGLGQRNSTRGYIFDLKSQKSTLISDPFQERLANITLGKTEDWNFTSSAGVEIKGSYFLPPDFDASKKYPMIVYYYGGTNPTSRRFEGHYPPNVFAAQGYVVYVIQPSGAIGFGQKFAALHVNAWGKRTAEDIIEGTKQFLQEHPYVNKDKIGCIGASYGGFMTMYLQTQTDMFAAAVSHAGISSISSYWGEGYSGYTYSAGASANSYPWNNPDLYVKQSPLFSADKVKTPILFTHGAVDTNVPVGESIQMYTALKILGKPAEFIQIKDENHGIMDYKRRVEWNNSIMAWFSKWLKDDNGWWKTLYPDSK